MQASSDVSIEEGSVEFAVSGLLMRGMELNSRMTDVGATFAREAETAPIYRMWSIEDAHPGMVRVAGGGRALRLEVWRVPWAGVTLILLEEPPGLCVGKVQLEDGSEVLGILAEPALLAGHREITEYGGWREYLASAKGEPREFQP